MSGIIGKKLGMSNIFGQDGEIIPVTVIQAGPCKVVNIRTKEKNGYEALQLSFGERKEKHTSKPLAGQFKSSGLTPARLLKEFKNFNTADFKVGDQLGADFFAEGEKIKVRGRNKGKGFQGVMRRHNFGGVGGTTHGQSDRLRAPGSIGSSSYPSRVFKGMKMAGRMGYENVTIAGLKVVKVIPEQNLIFVKGAVPGAVNTILELIKK
ncbi:MAG: 50S ribosomal protein L3 [Ignavibacteriaceae bacterium]